MPGDLGNGWSLTAAALPTVRAFSTVAISPPPGRGGRVMNSVPKSDVTSV
jgi:hypothetical protein